MYLYLVLLLLYLPYLHTGIIGLLKGDRKKFFKNCQFTSYVVIFCQGTFFSIAKLEFYLFSNDAIFKDCALFK